MQINKEAGLMVCKQIKETCLASLGRNSLCRQGNSHHAVNITGGELWWTVSCSFHIQTPEEGFAFSSDTHLQLLPLGVGGICSILISLRSLTQPVHVNNTHFLGFLLLSTIYLFIFISMNIYACVETRRYWILRGGGYRSLWVTWFVIQCWDLRSSFTITSAL